MRRLLLKCSILFAVLASLFYFLKSEIFDCAHGVPILMYHEITTDQSKPYSVTPNNFRNHLEQLHQAGYVTVKLEDVLLNKEDMRNKKGVVLRFDDSRRCHFNYIKNSENKLVIDPNCVVGILLEFHKKHPDFGCHALFCVIATEEFHQPHLAEKKLRFLLNNGMEIANHSYAHEHLTHATPQDIDRIFGKAIEHWEKMLGSEAQKINILALPYGRGPILKSAQKELQSFHWQGKTYKPLGILYAGHSYRKKCPLPGCPSFNRYKLPSFDVDNNNFNSIIKTLK